MRKLRRRARPGEGESRNLMGLSVAYLKVTPTWGKGKGGRGKGEGVGRRGRGCVGVLKDVSLGSKLAIMGVSVPFITDYSGITLAKFNAIPPIAFR